MQIRNARYSRTLLAAAGLLASVHVSATGVLAQTSTDEAKAPSAALNALTSRIDDADDLLAKGQVVRARALLLPLSDDAANLGLSDAQRHRVAALISQTTRKLKSLTPVEVCLQNADALFAQSNLKAAEQNAASVVNAPKATNEQVKLAKAILASIDTRRTQIAPEIEATLDAAVHDFEQGRYGDAKSGLERVSLSGIALSDERSSLLSTYQNKIVDLEQNLAARANAGMMQPGVVKPRPDKPAEKPAETQPEKPAPTYTPPQPEVKKDGEQPAKPATQPAAQPATKPATPPPAATPPKTAPAPAATPATQPAAALAPAPVDPIQAAQKWEAQNILAEADLAFDQRRLPDAVTKYSRLQSTLKDYLTADQQRHVSDRLAEARILLGGDNKDIISGVQANTKIARENVVAEFRNYMEQARTALNSSDVDIARQLSAQAKVKLDSGRDVMSEGEYESMLKDQKSLELQIAATSDQISRAIKDAQAKDLKEATDTSNLESRQSKEKKINEAIIRVRALQTEMKYEDALQVTDQILFLDPINPTGLLLREVLQDAILYQRVGHIQREKNFSYASQSVDNQDAIIAPPQIIKYPDNWPSKSILRGTPTAFVDSEENRRALVALSSKRIPAKFDDNSFEDVMTFVQTVTGLNMDVDWPSLEAAGVQKTTTVSLNLTNVPVKTILERVLEKVSSEGSGGAAYTFNDGVLTIASKEQINKTKQLLIYDIRDLLIEVPDYTQAPEFDLQSVLQNRGGRGGGGGGSQSPFRDNNQGGNNANRRTLPERTDDLIKIITTNVDSQGWQENGGDVGFIQQFQGNLIITQTQNNHRQIHGLLSKLREQRAMQINVETRFLLVNQNYFEQIGVDLDVYFNGRNNQVRTARAAAPGAGIQPSDFFDFQRGGLQRRVFGAPIDADGDGAADPQIGQVVAFPSPLSVVGAGQNSLGLTETLTSGSFANNILSKAPALGVAGQFLDDFQVDFLVKATQADQRTVTLTAPRLTFTNGQTSNIYVATQVSFVSDLTPIVSESAVGFDPTLNVVNEGVRMLVEGTISADRRYVTMNIDASIAKIERFNNTPVTALAGGQLVNSASTQSFIQSPTTTVTRVQTTVTVPDQGTILLGGQRLVTEGEVETGVPVLSKLPIFNRFFSNRTQSKEESTLLILMKPTILIQNEEEERSFPGLSESVRSPFGG